MPIRFSPAAAVFAVLVAVLALFSALAQHGPPDEAQIGKNTCSQVVVAPTMPPTFDLYGSTDFQGSADCIGWQWFIYENWRAKGMGRPNGGIGPNVFGFPVQKAGAYTTVWESYANPDDVFKTTLAAREHALTATNGLRTLSATSKGDGDDVSLNGFHQAFTFGWLTSRDHDVTFYEERIDNDELAYITQNRLTSKSRQLYCVTHGGLSLPAGQNDIDCNGNPANYGNLGAIEIKAAWIELHDPAKASRYLISRANLIYPDGHIVKDALIGLVGLHIIRKVPKAAQFAWATFEQVDNDPDATPYPTSPPTSTPPPPTATPLWTYYNSACTGANCKVNALATPCANGKGPPPANCQAYTVPTQTQRVTPVSYFSDDSTSVFRAALQKAHATTSVFRYYRMIDVQWPRVVTSTQQKPFARVPLFQASPDPSWPVANSTLETYVQGAACMDCHQSAAIASSGASAGRAHIRIFSPALLRAMRAPHPGASAAPYASDWSFVFAKARQP